MQSKSFMHIEYLQIKIANRLVFFEDNKDCILVSHYMQESM